MCARLMKARLISDNRKINALGRRINLILRAWQFSCVQKQDQISSIKMEIYYRYEKKKTYLLSTVIYFLQ